MEKQIEKVKRKYRVKNNTEKRIMQRRVFPKKIQIPETKSTVIQKEYGL